jgi:hypothetical protein
MFLNRMHTAMAAQLSSQRQVPNTMIAPWEQEFETLKPTIIQTNTGTLPNQLKNTPSRYQLTPLLRCKHIPHFSRPARSPNLLLLHAFHNT